MPSSSTPRVRPAISESDRDEIEAKPKSAPRRERPRDEQARHERDRDSRGRDKAKPTASSSKCWQRGLLAVLFLCGPVGTVISFLLLPTSTETHSHHAPPGKGANGAARVRMVHLSLADTDRRARFVLDENTVWESFMSGCRERHQTRHST